MEDKHKYTCFLQEVQDIWLCIFAHKHKCYCCECNDHLLHYELTLWPDYLKHSFTSWSSLLNLWIMDTTEMPITITTRTPFIFYIVPIS